MTGLTAPDLREWNASRVLERRAAERPDAVWLTDTRGRTATFGDIDRRATAIAAGLHRIGVRPGDRVLVMAVNSIDFVAVWFAINRAGGVIVPVNTALQGQLLAHPCRDAGATIMFVDAASLPAACAIAGSIAALTTLVLMEDGAHALPPGLHSLRMSELETAPASFVEPASDFRSIAAILYTSGTSGPAKGVLLPHAHLYLNAKLYIDQLAVTADDVIYCVLPLFHLNALTLQLYCSLIAGCRIVLAPHFSASGWIDEVRRHGATLTNLLGSMTEFIFNQPERPDDATNPLRLIVAAPAPRSIASQFEERFSVRLIELYGMTEITCPIYMPVEAPGRAGSCGKLLGEWFEARIVDPETDRECPDGSVGELVVRPLLPWGFMAGYHGRAEESVKAWRNLWFHTGDAMRRDEDGYYYFVDRLKDCVRRRGENISSYEVEQVMRGHADIAEVAVVGVASPYREGEQEIKACIVARRAPLDPLAIMAFCERELPRFAMPGIIEEMAALPKTNTGKVEKRILREAGIGPGCWIAADIDRPRKKA